jgi:DNA polymerase-4
MDAFFASVEELDNPSLRGRPLLVGGPGKRGVVAAASYAARKFGAHSAMPMVEARRRCPTAVVVAPRHGRYAEVSDSIFAIFRRFTPLVEGLSLDEAFLDVTDSQALFGGGETIARKIKAAISAEIGLTASAGVAPCKFAAKVASDLQKPDGLVVVPPGTVAAFLSPLPLERMWGVGPRAAEALHAKGFATIGDLAAAPESELGAVLGPSWGGRIRELALGIDDRPVLPGRTAESIGAEETFESDITTRRPLELYALELSGRVARRLGEAQMQARVIVVKVKYSSFKLQTRRLTLPAPVGDTDSLYQAAKTLLDRFELAGRRVRLLGVTAAELLPRPGAGTLELFPDEALARRQRLEGVVAEVRGRFGRTGLIRAALLETGSHAAQRDSPSQEVQGQDDPPEQVHGQDDGKGRRKTREQDH